MEPRWERVHAREGGRGPGRRWGHTCNAVAGGRLVYVFGGYGESTRQTNDVHVFDTVNHQWSKPIISGMPPPPRDSHTSTTVGNKIFVFGGTDGSSPLKDLHILDTSSSMWISPLIRGKGPDAREGHSSSLVGNKLFIFGGCGKFCDKPEHIFYDDLYSLDTGTFIWTKINSFGQVFAPRAGHCTLALGKNLFVYGGFADDRNLYSDLHVFDVDSGAWTRVITSDGGPSPRFSAAGDCIDAQKGVFLLFGGCSSSLEALGDIFFLNAGSAVDITFQAMITSASPYGCTLETCIDGVFLRGMVFLTLPNNPHGLKMVESGVRNSTSDDGPWMLSTNMVSDTQLVNVRPRHGSMFARGDSTSSLEPEIKAAAAFNLPPIIPSTRKGKQLCVNVETTHEDQMDTSED